MKLRHALYFLALVAAACQTSKPEASQDPQAQKPPLFELLAADKTGVDFNNVLDEGLNTNVLMYEYFYNGGGVATADFNGDGLIDIYFTSNMGTNALYLNEGGMRFRDVTAVAKVKGRDGPWKTGVTYADVNGDGKLDLYVCYSGTVRKENRTNQLFINQGNNEQNIPVFSEEGAAYGLASTGYSNHGYFFDYDKDGDLDMLLLNHNPQSLPVLNEVKNRELLKVDDAERGVRLFRHTNGRFEDVTIQAGISSSPLTYALGAGIADIDNDGWEDIYISNDYAVPDYLYINDRDGTFTDKLREVMGHVSHFSMGNDVADINNDGAVDIFTLDMLPEDNARQKLLMSPDNYAKFDFNVRSGFHYQYMRNMLQLNNGNGTFSEVGQVAGISNTDWSWAALFADFDNDGFKDLFVTNGYLRDYTNLDFIKYMDDVVKQKGRLKRQDVLDVITHMPSSKVRNYIYSNNGGFQFTDRSTEWGMIQPSNSNGAAYADLDNDGDLDLIVNNINEKAFVFENKTKGTNYLGIVLKGEGMNTHGIGAKVTVSVPGKKQHQQMMPGRGYLSAVTPVLHFGLHNDAVADSVIIQWPSGKLQVMTNVPANSTLIAEEVNATSPTRRPDNQNHPVNTVFTKTDAPFKFAHSGPAVNDFKRQPQLITGMSHNPPVVVSADFNNDGRVDFFYGGSIKEPPHVLIRNGGGMFTRKQIHGGIINGILAADAIAFDADNDGDVDVYVASGGYHDMLPDDPRLQDRLFINDGAGNLSISMTPLPKVLSSKGCVATADVNGDGLMDLFVGGRVVPGRYPETPESYLLLNRGNLVFENETEKLAPDLRYAGMITDAVWADMNADARLDLVIAGEWMPIKILINEDGILKDRSDRFLNERYTGWWNSLLIKDLNNDNRPDIVAGNYGLNSQFRASAEEPIEMYFKDFDGNGSVDPILCTYIQGTSYPYLTRDELLEQLPYMRQRFTNYKSYSNVTSAQLFNERDLESATRLEVTHLETTLFLSSGDGRLSRELLPIESQFSCVNTITAGDFDGDGKDDLLLFGNSSHAKLKIGKLDANFGTFLKGNGSGKYMYVPQIRSGLDVRGDVKSVLRIGNELIVSSSEGTFAYTLNAAMLSGARDIAQVK
ncbi:MAG TPA: VCBS repeat-containing protein [Ohtaekwangia sp.]|nr:VCBS repeat-containing protein [Ohtaekwangia sp.]